MMQPVAKKMRIRVWKPVTAFVLISLALAILIIGGAPMQPSLDNALCQELYGYVQALNQACENQQISGGILVTKQGEIAASHFYGMSDYQEQLPFSQDTRFLLCSTTKLFTAIGIMQLQEKGLLQLDDPIAQYFPGQFCEATITIRQLLTHTGGLLRDVTDQGLISPYEQTERHQLQSFILRNPLLFHPGSDMAYSNAGYQLLAGIIEQASGLSYEKYLQKHIFGPANMRNTGCADTKIEVKNLAVGYEYKYGSFREKTPYNLSHAFGSGNIFTTPYDMALFDKALTTGVLIKEETLVHMTTDNTGLNRGYGYGCFVGTFDGYEWFGHTGNFSSGYFSYYAHFPQEDVGLVLLFNTVWNDNNSIVKAVSAIALQRPYPLPQKRQQISTAHLDLARYEGTYQTSNGQTMTVKNVDGLLLASFGTVAYLAAYAEDRFYDSMSELWEYIFETDQSNQVVSCVVSNGFDTIRLERLKMD
ncbi:MAG: serine hydrolase [Candidatus Pelethousia sp.]|nr:serine hydrolase [Candidatus Pelethousia sp.]